MTVANELKRMIKNDIKLSSGGTESSFSLGVVATVFVEMDFWFFVEVR